MQPPSTRILIIDDDDTNCELVQLMLQLSNPDYEVIYTLTSEEGLSLAATQRFDLYILDYRLRDRSGLEVCRALRQHQPDARVMFFTGEAHERERREAMRAGANAYLIKPNNLGQLTEIANGLLSMRQSAATRSAPFSGYSDSQMDATPKSVPPAASRAGETIAERRIEVGEPSVFSIRRSAIRNLKSRGPACGRRDGLWGHTLFFYGALSILGCVERAPSVNSLDSWR